MGSIGQRHVVGDDIELRLTVDDILKELVDVLLGRGLAATDGDTFVEELAHREVIKRRGVCPTTDTMPHWRKLLMQVSLTLGEPFSKFSTALARSTRLQSDAKPTAFTHTSALRPPVMSRIYFTSSSFSHRIVSTLANFLALFKRYWSM